MMLQVLATIFFSAALLLALAVMLATMLESRDEILRALGLRTSDGPMPLRRHSSRGARPRPTVRPAATQSPRRAAA